MTEKPKEIRGRHKRESKWMQIGMAAVSRCAESYAHLPDPAAIAYVSNAVGACRHVPLHAQTFNQVACAAIIR